MRERGFFVLHNLLFFNALLTKKLSQSLYRLRQFFIYLVTPSNFQYGLVKKGFVRLWQQADYLRYLSIFRVLR